MYLSKEVTLFMEPFLSALHYKYLFTNLKQSSADLRYMYMVEIPKYLHNKPKAVILHCLNCKASSPWFC